MTAEGHFIFAIASAIFAKHAELTPVLANADWWHIIPATLLTCLLPDIDHPQSFLGQRLRWISQLISKIFGHRGFTHSLLAIVGWIALLELKLPANWFIPDDAFQSMVLGYFSHIIADMLTPAGVPLLWPCRWRFRLPLLNTRKDSQLERILCFSLVLYAIWFPPDMPLYGAKSWTHNVLNSIKTSFSKIITPLITTSTSKPYTNKKS